MASATVASLIPALAAAAFGLAACGDDGGSNNATPDAGVPIDAPPTGNSCDPATVLPTGYAPVAKVSAGLVTVTTASGVTSGTIDATAGGLAASADNPYIYVDLKNGVRVDVNDLDARTNNTWDIALKRSSLRTDGGDSGGGNRKLAVVAAATLAEVTAAPTADKFTTDKFTTADCKLDMLDGGEPKSAFGQWYDYDVDTHTVTPMPQVYVLERNNGSHVAFRFTTYYGDTTNTMRGAFYAIEWKNL